MLELVPEGVNKWSGAQVGMGRTKGMISFSLLPLIALHYFRSFSKAWVSLARPSWRVVTGEMTTRWSAMQARVHERRNGCGFLFSWTEISILVHESILVYRYITLLTHYCTTCHTSTFQALALLWAMPSTKSSSLPLMLLPAMMRMGLLRHLRSTSYDGLNDND